MKNKKGFTLVELLAVIVILAVLVLIAVPRVVGILNSIKQKTFATEAENIIKSAKNAYSGRSLDNLGIKNCYTLSDLNDYTDKNFEGYSGSVYINPETNEYKIWLSKSPYIINGSLSGDIKVTELIQYQPASVSCEDIEILACASYKYTLYVDAYGGKFSDNSTTKTYEMQSGETQEVVVPAKAEHTFGSWRVIGSPESFVDGVVTMGEQNVTLVAEWVNDGAETRKLYVNPDGGNWDNFTTTQEYDIEEFKTKLISTPTRFGYIFDGWEITGSPQSFVNELFRMGEEDVSLKALWTPFYTYTGTSELLNVDGKWKLKLKTDGDLVFNQDLTIDVFLVGGGGGGGYSTAAGFAIRGGGGSGRTKTVESIPVVAGESYTVDIGNGGSVNTEGGTTTAFATITSEATVSGGNPGRALYYTHSGTMGGSGGSGGGAWGAGGTNGGNGASYSGYDSGGPFSGGAGLDATTREFGEPSGTIYAYGGAGTNDYARPVNPPTFIGDNTGTGGNGGAAGYSGVVIIRVHTSTN